MGDNSEDTKRLILDMVNKLDSVKRVRLFMIEDLEKTIGLASTPRGAPNFMLALALCAYTEYWGRLVEGKASRYGDVCFKAFFERMGPCYAQLINDPRLTKAEKDGKISYRVYWAVRNGLAHSYLVEANSVINMGRGTCGLEYAADVDRFTFNIQTYFDDFRVAVDKYLIELESPSSNLWSKFEMAMQNKPELL